LPASRGRYNPHLHKGADDDDEAAVGGGGGGSAFNAGAGRAGTAEAGRRRAEGHEFLDLFQRNHYPILKAREKAGQYTSVRTYVPEFHGDGRADWTFAVELVVPPGAPATPTDGEIIAKLYPDRATFAKEEQRRFEILAAHWDVPLNRLNLDTRKPAR
jgi:hypothetical protein